MAVKALWVIQLALTALLFGHVAANFSDLLADCSRDMQSEVTKCFSNTGIDLSKIASTMANPALLQVMTKEFKELCQNNKLTLLVDCVFNKIKTTCSKKAYDSWTQLMNIEGFKEVTGYICDNIDEMTDPAGETCMESAEPILKPCMENKGKEIVEMIKKYKEGSEQRVMAEKCLAYGTIRSCMKQALKSCKGNGKHILKILEMINPPACQKYTLAAGMTKPSIMLVFLAVISAALAYMW
ncbi:uncharacterized protein LOC135496162 [Lineus longissimus]|uniref:uncharacterized protein LOC135496162 n=1 Tax=Lineus longissimus TaxID=88925 RepID=UPI00315DE56A